jgi:hypothetical protein
MQYCDGEKCKGRVPTWPVHLTRHTTDFLHQFNGASYSLDALPIASPIRVVGGEIARAVDETEAALAALRIPVMARAGPLCQPIVDKRPAADRSETEVDAIRERVQAFARHFQAEIEKRTRNH